MTRQVQIKQDGQKYLMLQLKDCTYDGGPRAKLKTWGIKEPDKNMLFG